MSHLHRRPSLYWLTSLPPPLQVAAPPRPAELGHDSALPVSTVQTDRPLRKSIRLALGHNQPGDQRVVKIPSAVLRLADPTDLRVCYLHPNRCRACDASNVTSLRVLGVDAYRHGWVGVALADAYAGAYVAPHIDELVAAAEADGALSVVAVDMPIGLPDAGPRQADVLAKRRVGPLHASVFMTPIREALLAEEFGRAVEVARLRAGAGISRQSFALRAKLLEVDAWVGRRTHRVIEAHPEVSFAALAGRPLGMSKKTWGGVTLRRELLLEAGIVLPDSLGSGDVAGVDDVLDAAVMS